MRARSTLPLGVDVGVARTRVALVERAASGAVRLVAVASRPTREDPAAAIAEARSELGCRERRCVLALGPADAVVRAASFPAMRPTERERAARFEAMRYVSYAIADAALRVTPLGSERCVVAVARRTRLEQRVGEARRAGLRPIAVDDLTFALMRAFPYADAVVDVGERASVLVIRGEPIPSVRAFAIGGRAFTEAVVSSLGVDAGTAERRKRSVGLAGAGETARDALVEQLATALIDHRANARADVRTIALCGNGARLTGLSEALERATAIPVRLAALAADASDTLPADVVRAASPDWGLAYGLALWESAA